MERTKKLKKEVQREKPEAGPDVIVVTPDPKPKKLEMPMPEVETPKRSIMVRPQGYRNKSGDKGKSRELLTNHIKVAMSVPNAVFYQYSVSITSAVQGAVVGKRIRRMVMHRLCLEYSAELRGKQFAYDGEKSLYTYGPLAQNEFEFNVMFNEDTLRRISSTKLATSPSEIGTKWVKPSPLSRFYNVQIGYVNKIQMKPIRLALRGGDAENTDDALRAINTILRQQAVKRECLLLRRSYFDDQFSVDVGGGVSACRGFHSSFRITEIGLSLNMDVSSTLILTPGPVLNFLLTNQNVERPQEIDWGKAKQMLKNLIIETKHNQMEFKITGISDNLCSEQLFLLKNKRDGAEVELTVYDYYTKICKVTLSDSVHLPCLNVGKENNPIYIPLEICWLVSLQRYTKSLSPMQRSSFGEKSSQKPKEIIQTITNVLSTYRYGNDPMLKRCGISIEDELTAVYGRVLEAPTLNFGDNKICKPQNGRWNYNQKRLHSPMRIELWAVINFSARCDTNHLSQNLISCGQSIGMLINPPFKLIEENPKWRTVDPIARVENMLGPFDEDNGYVEFFPEFLLCVLPKKKNCDIYGPWKRMCHKLGIVTQCISPTKINDQYCDIYGPWKRMGHSLGIVTQCISPTKINDQYQYQYLTNVLLKINIKLGGINSLLTRELVKRERFQKYRTMIVGMVLNRGSPGQDAPSVAAVVSVVGSRNWPMISSYMADVRTQSPKEHMIGSLYEPLANDEDYGIMRELLDEFRESSWAMPEHIIIFRGGVSESQFNQVLNIELEQIIQALKRMGETTLPKFTVIVAQKSHHTKFFAVDRKIFEEDILENVPAGTVVDTKIVHPRNYDFYMCAHDGGANGTSRPAHYHVLLDEIGFSANALQRLVHSLSYVYQPSTTAISIVAPIRYAQRAAAQMRQCLSSATSSELEAIGADDVNLLVLPDLADQIKKTMFFC